MNASNNAKLAAKKAAGINIHLYSDDHPETTVKGTGFKDAETARRTIELVKLKPRNRQVWTINAMYHRAKHHPNQTPSMRDAMDIYETWLKDYRQEREGNNKIDVANGKKAVTKRRRMKDDTDDPIHGGIATKQNQKPRSRSELELEYKMMFNVTLPKIAKTEKWPIHLNHCVMRVALDAYWQCCWYEKLDQKRGALKSMTVPQIENVILVGERMASEGKEYVSRLNTESLGYRGKSGPGGVTRAVRGDARQSPKKRARKQKLSLTDGLVADPVSSRTPTIVSSSKSDTPGDNSHAVSEFNENALLQVQHATTGRASCRNCKEKIGKGEHRVGMTVWSSGRQITVWHHPFCFLGDDQNDGDGDGDGDGGGRSGVVRVEKLTKGSTAKCKYTGSRFTVGDLRLVLEVGVTKTYYALAAVGPLLGPVYDVLPAIPVPFAGKGVERSPDAIPSSSTTSQAARGSSLRGLDQLNNDDREAILAAFCAAPPPSSRDGTGV